MVSLHCGKDINGIPYANKRLLNQYAVDMLRDYKPEILEWPQTTDIDAFAEFYLEANVEYRPLTPEQHILGVTVFDGGNIMVYDHKQGYIKINVPPKTILIEQGIMNSMEPGRCRFTLAHEVAGHLACHSDIKISSNLAHRIADECDTRIVMCRPNEGNACPNPKTPEQWLEWQADYMASAILMPEPTFREAVESLYSFYGPYIPELAVSVMRNSKNVFYDMVRNLACIYQVSATAARIRLNDLIMQS